MVFEQLHEPEQLLVGLGKLIAHRVERLGDANARDDVFALRVLEEVAVRLVLPRRRVARERDSGTGVVTLVAEHHRLHVDRGSEIVGDPLEAAVVARTAAVPRLEHGLDRVAELLLRIGREVDAGFGLHDALEGVDEAGHVLGAQLGVDARTLALDQIVQRLLEQLTRDVEDDLAEHLHEAAIRVVRETLVLRLLREALDGIVVEPEVQDRVHHAGHRERRAGAHGNE